MLYAVGTGVDIDTIDGMVFLGSCAGALLGSAVESCEEALWHRGSIPRSSGGE